MATGKGKTFVAFQIIYRLWQVEMKKNAISFLLTETGWIMSENYL